MKTVLSLMLSLFLITACSTVKPENQDHYYKLDYSRQKSWNFVSGKMQSPINIVTADVAPLSDETNIDIYHRNKIAYVADNGHTIEVGLESISVIYSRLFKMQQLHFHSPSEHTIDGIHYDMEMHIVHTSESGRIAVIGVFLTPGKHNQAFQQILDSIIPSEKNISPAEADISKLIPKEQHYYHYLGSLTTPPLSENTEWYIYVSPVEVSAEQLSKFREYYDENNRAVQPLNERAVLYAGLK